MSGDGHGRLAEGGIWLYAAGYFLCYVPYAGGTKALSKGLIPGLTEPVTGFAMLPVTVLASVIGMTVFLTAMGWWRYARQWQLGAWSLPRPGKWTLLSGLCTAAIIGTTTLAYTFSGVSIVFMMLLMRGGVLALAPIVDRLTGRRVRWYSAVALLLSLGALLAAFLGHSGTALTAVAIADVAAYLGSYFFRLRLMSRLSKSGDTSKRVRYFAEEMMVSSPVLLVLLAAVALLGDGSAAAELRFGFTGFLLGPAWPAALLIGACSFGTGVFGGLILLEPHENSYCVPLNRASSILAGLLATLGLWVWLDQPAPGLNELVGAGLILAAVAALSVPALRGSRT